MQVEKDLWRSHTRSAMDGALIEKNLVSADLFDTAGDAVSVK
jgi:hypothetical protein